MPALIPESEIGHAKENYLKGLLSGTNRIFGEAQPYVPIRHMNGGKQKRRRQILSDANCGKIYRPDLWTRGAAALGFLPKEHAAPAPILTLTEGSRAESLGPL
jgi:hypothetical protein